MRLKTNISKSKAYSIDLANAPSPLNISTYDDAGQSVHPSIVYIPGKWNSYEYWMAFTPYAGGNDDLENPSIRVSKDGFTWEKRAGMPDPVVPAPSDVASGGFSSDPCLVYVGTTMYMFYRTTTAGGVTTTYFRTCASGSFTWSSAVTTNLPALTTSPSMYFDGTTWHCWAMHYAGSYPIKYYTSSDAITWTEGGACNLVVPGYTNWHLEVIKTDLGYETLLCSYPVGTGNAYTTLFHGVSSDGLNWTITNNNKPVIDASIGGWDNAQIYKATFLKDAKGYRVWYSAVNKDTSRRWNIGYSEGKTIDKLVGKSFGGPYYEGGKRFLNNVVIDGELYFDTPSAKAITSRANLHLRSGKVTTTAPIYLQYEYGREVLYCGGGTTVKSQINTDGSYEVIDANAGIILRSPDASRWRIKIGNDGVLTTTKL